jgi:hypothetical protein
MDDLIPTKIFKHPSLYIVRRLQWRILFPTPTDREPNPLLYPATLQAATARRVLSIDLLPSR